MRIKVKSNQSEEIEGLFAEYPYVMHHADLQDTKVPWHWHSEVEFNYIICGEAEVLTTGHKYTFHHNEAFFINTNVLCTIEPIPGKKPAVMHSHLFHSAFLSGHFKSIFETKYLNPVLENKNIEIVEIRGKNNRQLKILTKLRQVAALQQQTNTEFQTRNLFSEIWLLLLEEIREISDARQPSRTISQERLLTMMSYVNYHYPDRISLEDIAASASVSKRECLRCFKSGINKTPFEYLMEYRLEKAARLLRTTDLPIVDIAMRSGFSNSAYFGKLFKSTYQASPGAYRKSKMLSLSNELTQPSE